MEVSKPVSDIYDFVENLPEGSVIWMSFDYHNSTQTECDPQAQAFLRHAFRKNHKVFITSLVADGQVISRHLVTPIAEEMGKVYGEDYTILGYKAGFFAVMMQVCQNLRGIYNTDIDGVSVDEIPMMKDIHNAKDISMVFTISDNASFDYYVQVANTQFHIPVAGGSTAVSVPKLYVFINSGQAIGVLGGLKGAAEYEKLIGKQGTATAGMNAQSAVHIILVLMILLSNVVYFISKFKDPDHIG